MNTTKLEILLYGKKIKRLSENCFSKLKNLYGLKQIDLDILMYFCDNPGNCSSDLCAYFGHNKGQVSKAMERLCALGYILEKQDKKDRRYMGYYITDTAKNIIDEIEKRRLKTSELLMEGISEDEKKELETILSKVITNFEKLSDTENVLEEKDEIDC